MNLKAISIGDNCVDNYVRPLQERHVGGNSVNVAVHLQRGGISSAYLGAVGDDDDGRWIIHQLASEDIDVSHVHILPGHTARSDIALDEGERHFLFEDFGVGQNLQLDEHDLEFIAQHNLAHWSILGFGLDELERLHRRGVLNSLDYSSPDRYNKTVLRETLPHVDIAFFSGLALGGAAELEPFARDMLRRGPRLVVITRGEQGSLAVDSAQVYVQSAVPVALVDTLGAGDAFIGSFLAQHLLGASVQNCLSFASARLHKYVGISADGSPAKQIDPRMDIPEKMSAVVWDSTAYPDCLSVRQVPVPEPPPCWVLVHNRAAGICGSDLHLLFNVTRHLVPEKNLPAILGHENAGVVVKLGDGVTRVQIGERVAVEPLHSCLQFGGTCPRCLAGQYHLCASGLVHVGIPVTRMLPGGWGEYSIVHETRVEPIPPNLSFEEAALTDILACAVHAANLADARPGVSAVVIGCGIIGLDMVQVLRARGVTDIIAVARHEFQAENARHLGAREIVLLRHDTDPVRQVLKLAAGTGVDQVYECVGGETDGVDQAIAMACPGGTVVMMGEFAGRRPIDLLTQLNNEVRLLPSNSYCAMPNGRREFQVALELLCQSVVIHSRLATNRFAPTQFKEAIDATAHKCMSNLIKGIFIREE